METLITQTKELSLKDFDEIFELESQGCLECGGFELIDKREIRYPKGEYHCEYDLEKIKAFITQELTTIATVTEERVRKEMVEYRISWDIGNKDDDWVVQLWKKNKDGTLELFTQLNKKSDECGSFDLQALSNS